MSAHSHQTYQSYPSNKSLTIYSLWQRLVSSIYLCYCSQSIYMLLAKANIYLAFKDMQVRIIDALTKENFDYDSNNEIITEYAGIVKNISCEKESLGTLVIDTHYGKKTLINGKIIPF